MGRIIPTPNASSRYRDVRPVAMASRLVFRFTHVRESFCVEAIPIIVLSILSIWTQCAVAGSTVSVPVPERQINAIKFGFTPAYFPSNREFFKGYNINKLMAADEGSKLIMLSENVAVLYGTRPADGIRGHTPDSLQAYFVDVSTGAVLRKQQWRVRARRGISDGVDSEARILALSGGRYLVVADRKLNLYTADGTLSVTQVLTDGIWAAKSVSGGNLIFLRHQLYSDDGVAYLWLDSGTLKVQQRLDDANAVRAQMPYSGTGDSVTYELRDGLHEVTPGSVDRTICAKPICRFPADARWEVLGPAAEKCLVFVSSQGLLVASEPAGPAWSRLTGYPGTGPVSMYVALSDISLQGDRFALLLNGNHRSFDGVRLQGKWQYFIYDVAAARLVFLAPQISVNGDVREALSPTGKRFLTFDGNSIRVYEVP